jgi:heat shock protein HtpX
MPEVGIYDSADPNAFATGMNRNNALVAVSTGLMRSMDQGEVEAVLGHEVGHVANGDMVTLALIQGVVNTFVIFLARVLAGHFVDRVVFKNESGSRSGVLDHHHRRRDPAGDPGLHHRHVVLAPA